MKNLTLFFPKTWFRAGVFTAFTFSFSLNLQAQTTGPAIQWDKTYGGNGSHSTMYTTCHLQQTADGGYIFGGTSSDPIGGDKSQASKGIEDYWIVKTAANGNKQWDKAIGGSSWDILTSIQQTSDGGYILGGTSGSGISGDKTETNRGAYDYWVVKLDANGNKIWDKTLGGNDWDELTSVQQTSDGGYILGGHSRSGMNGDKTQSSQGNDDYWVIKLNANGNKVWDKAFGGNYIDELTSLQQTSDGGYILGGSSWSGLSGDRSQASKGNGDYWIIKIDAAGNKLWDKYFGGNMNDILNSLHQTADGGYILGGYSGSGISGDKTQASKGGDDFWVVKLDANGNKTWDRTIGGSANDELTSLQQTSDGGYILGGRSFSGISGDKTEALRGFFDYWVVKMDTSGNKLWDKTLGGDASDDLTSLQQTADGGYITGGQSTSQINGDKTKANKGYDDFWIVKLGAGPTGFNEIEAAFPVSIFPNPCNGKFNLELNNVTEPTADVIAADVLGSEIMHQDFQVIGNHITQEFELKTGKGIYLLTIKIGEKTLNRKIVVD